MEKSDVSFSWKYSRNHPEKSIPEEELSGIFFDAQHHISIEDEEGNEIGLVYPDYTGEPGVTFEFSDQDFTLVRNEGVVQKVEGWSLRDSDKSQDCIVIKGTEEAIYEKIKKLLNF